MKKGIALIFAVLLFVSCHAREQYVKRELTFYDYFDTDIKIQYYAPENVDAQKFEEVVRTTLKKYHEMFDIYHNYATPNIKTVNDEAGKKKVSVPPELCDLLKKTLEDNKKYGNKVNIAMGAVLREWEKVRDKVLAGQPAQLPDMAILKEKMAHAKLSTIEVGDGTVYITDPEVSLDLGAVAKGYATEKLADTLKAEGITSFIINAGGNVKAGDKPLEEGRKTWGIGIMNPHVFDEKDQNQIIDAYYGNNVSVVTSGSYQRFFELNGKRYNHIIDPDTLMPADRFLSVTVVTEDSAVADFLSTTLFLTDLEHGKALVDSLPGVDAMWIAQDGTITKTWKTPEK